MAEFGTWQPIETAPTDGTRVLICVRDDNGVPVDVATAVLCRMRDDRIVTDADGFYFVDDVAEWMPLPQLPKEAQP